VAVAAGAAAAAAEAAVVPWYCSGHGGRGGRRGSGSAAVLPWYFSPAASLVAVISVATLVGRPSFTFSMLPVSMALHSFPMMLNLSISEVRNRDDHL